MTSKKVKTFSALNTQSKSLEEIEAELQTTWSQYIYCLDRYGLNQTTKELKLKYLDLYEYLKKTKLWNSLMTENESA